MTLEAMTPDQTLEPFTMISSKHTESKERRMFTRPLSAKKAALGLSLGVLISGALFLLLYQTLRPQYFASGGLGGSDTGLRNNLVFTVDDKDFSLIPKDEILSGGPAKDGIPALTDPAVVSADESGLNAADRVIGVEIAGEARAYPLRILNWHEIVNDTLGGQPIAVTYCPLCDSAVVFDREIGDQVREFGVSGLLYNSNVLMYDRQEDPERESLWSQLMFAAVVGPAAEEGLELEMLPAQFTTWEAWSERFPDTTSLSFETGYRRNYGANPYTDYFQSSRLMFPVNPPGEEAADLADLPNKEPVIIISIDGALKGYPVSRLKEALASGAKTLVDEFQGKEITFTAVDDARETFQVTNEQGNAAPIAFSFWFKFRAAHPQAEIFNVKGENNEGQ